MITGFDIETELETDLPSYQLVSIIAKVFIRNRLSDRLTPIAIFGLNLTACEEIIVKYYIINPFTLKEHEISAKDAINQIKPVKIPLVEPRKIVTYCPNPKCGRVHIDSGLWALVAHKRHQCQYCKREWTPFDEFTCGVKKIKEGKQCKFCLEYGLSSHCLYCSRKYE